MADTPAPAAVPPIKQTNRRWMAWICLTTGLVTGVAVLIAALTGLVPAERVDKIDMALVALFGFLAPPVIIYMGGNAIMNLKHGK